MLKKTLTTTILILVLTLSYKAKANQGLYTESVCFNTIELVNKPKVSEQVIALNETVQMKLKSVVALNNSMAAQLATNVVCQQLTGSSYTGSKEEWKHFFNSAISGLIKADYKNIQFTLVGDEAKVYASQKIDRYMTKEYIIEADGKNSKQIIKNLAVLDKAHNILYTFSVSGSKDIDSNVKIEFERLLKSIKSTDM